MGKKADRFADAVRILFYGNGDMLAYLRDLEKILSEHDGTKPDYNNRIMQFVKRDMFLNGPSAYHYFSGNEWNEPGAVDHAEHDDD